MTKIMCLKCRKIIDKSESKMGKCAPCQRLYTKEYESERRPPRSGYRVISRVIE